MEQGSTTQQMFQHAYETYAEELFGFCSSKVRYREEAFDIVHDAFVKFWGVLSTHKTIDNTRAYLYSIVRNKIIDYYRSVVVHRVFPLTEELIQTLSDETQNMANDLDTKMILQMLNTLPESYREPVTYRYLDGMAVNDIATILNISPGATTKRLRRGVDLLREKISETST
jgi:RNA polymerase sigma factor (sigma-70 family)